MRSRKQNVSDKHHSGNSEPTYLSVFISRGMNKQASIMSHYLQYLIVSLPTWPKKWILQLIHVKGGREAEGEEEPQLHLLYGFWLFHFMWVVQLESAVFHQTNGSQQVGSLTWLTQDECYKSYRSQRLMAGEINSGSPSSLWMSVKVCACGSYQELLYIGYF